MANEKNVYLELEMSTGRMYQYSKTEKDGFTKTVTENPTTKVQTISYRKYFEDGVFGNLIGLSVRDTNFGKRLSVVLDHPVDDLTYFMTLPLFDAKDRITSFATSVIRCIKSLEQGAPYRFYPYAIEDKENIGKDGKPRKNYGVSIRVARLEDNAIDDVNKLPMLTLEKVERHADGTETIIPGDVPRIEWKESVTGEPKADTEKRDKFLFTLLKEYEIALSGGATKKTFNSKDPASTPVAAATQAEAPALSTITQAPAQESVKSEPVFTKEAVVEVAEDEEELDLPF